MRIVKHLISAILAGFAIALGGAVSLAAGGGIPSALLGGLGILIVMIFDMSLFTMKTSDLMRANRDLERRIGKLAICIIGNVIGAVLCGIAFLFASNVPVLYDAATEMSEGLVAVVLQSMLGGLLVYTATHGYNRVSGGFAGCFIAILSFAAIEICGFSFAVTDIFHMAASGTFSFRMLMLAALEIFGNFLGVLIPVVLLAIRKRKENE